MTQKRIVMLAYQAALEIWNRELEHLQELPDNPFTQARERKAYAELEEIRAEMIKIENAE